MTIVPVSGDGFRLWLTGFPGGPPNQQLDKMLAGTFPEHTIGHFRWAST